VRYASYTLTIFLSAFVYGQSDSLLHAVEQSEGLQKITALHNVVTDQWLKFPDQAMTYGVQALELSEQLKDSLQISKSLRLIAGVYYYRGDFEESLDYNTRAFNIGQQLGDSSLINNGYNNMGLLHYNLGSYQLALEYLLRSKSIKEKTGENYGMSIALNNIGLVFDRLGDYDEARKYFNEAYSVAFGANVKHEQLYSLNNVGSTYLKEGNYTAALAHFRGGEEVSKEIENINWGSASLRGIGAVLLEQGELDSARYYLKESLDKSQSIDDKKGMAESYYYLAKGALIQNDLTKAFDYLNEGERIARQIQLRQQMLDNLKLYAEIFSASGDNEMESRYLSQYINLRDSLYQDVVSRNLSLVPIKLKEEEDRYRFTTQQAQLRNQTVRNQLFVTIIVITIPLLIIMIVLFRKNHIKNKELIRNNEELIKTQKLLITSEKMASLGVLAAGVGHEINNPLNFIKNGIEALNMKLNGSLNEDLKSYFKIINEGVERASNIVKSLSHFSRRGPSTDEKCNIHDIIENCLLILHNRIRNRVRITTDFTKQSPVVIGNEGRLHQAMMNIIANAEQAIGDEGNIKITTRRKQGFMVVEVSDDGEGIPEENLMKISDPFFTTKAPGEGTGLGLFITSSIIEEHSGILDVNSETEQGTTFTIKLPLKQ